MALKRCAREECDQVGSIAVSKMRWQTGGLAGLRMRSIVKLRIDSDLANLSAQPSPRPALRSRNRDDEDRSKAKVSIDPPFLFSLRMSLFEKVTNIYTPSGSSSFFSLVTRSIRCIRAVETILGRKNVTSRAMIHAT